MQGNLRQQGAVPQRIPMVNNRRPRVVNIPRRQNEIPQHMGGMNIPPAVNLVRNYQEQHGGRGPQGYQGGHRGPVINQAGRAPGGAQQLPVQRIDRNLQNAQINYQQGPYQIPRFAPNINVVPPRFQAAARGGYGPAQVQPFRQPQPYRAQP